MELFHGSTKIIETPSFGTGNPHNDYGLGFYCTENIELAKEWACRTPEDGFANAYSLDLSGLNIMDLTKKEWHILNWLALLLVNRIFDISNPIAQDAKEYIISTFLPLYEECDVIVGYRADDSYFSFAKAFLNGQIPLSALSEAMHLGKLGQQYCIRSRKAFDRVQFTQAITANGQEYYIKRITRDNRAREEYLKILSVKGHSKEEIFMLDILRQEWKNDDERLQ